MVKFPLYCKILLIFAAMVSVSNISYFIGGRALYENASMFIKPKDKIGLIGLNGRGKSTLLRIINGEIRSIRVPLARAAIVQLGFSTRTCSPTKPKTQSLPLPWAPSKR